jgi:DNA-binding transcriptional regulator GbsR (MarR family)
MNSIQEIKTEFVQIYEDMLRAKGLPTIFGRIMANLLLEGRKLSHKEISKLTGYSISSVSRTLDQMIRMGIVHKHKDASRKHFVFHVSASFPEMVATSMVTILRVYRERRNEINKLVRKIKSLKLEEKENDELNRLQATLENVEETIKFSEGIIENTIKELRANPREPQ